jgi:hypothetical protein
MTTQTKTKPTFIITHDLKSQYTVVEFDTMNESLDSLIGAFSRCFCTALYYKGNTVGFMSNEPMRNALKARLSGYPKTIKIVK